MRKAFFVLFASAVSGVLLVLSLPLGEHAYLAPIAFAPLFVAVRKTRFLVGFVASLITVFIAAKLTETGVLYQGLSNPPEANPAWLYTGYGLFGFPLAVMSGLLAEPKLADKPAWWFAAAGTLLEAVMLLQLPAHFALSLYRNYLAVGLASLGGIWLVSFLLWWANLLLARAVEAKRWALVPVIPMLIYATMSGKMGDWIRPIPDDKVHAVQVSIDDKDLLAATHKEATEQGSLLGVWPEFGGIIFGATHDAGELRELSKTTSPFVTSFPDASTPKPFNVASVFEAGAESERYAKRKLFGGESQMHQPGSQSVAVQSKAAKVGLLVCYDACFPAVVRKTALLPGVGLIALPTIDPVAPYHFLAAVHAAYTPFRAAESGVSIVRADANAYSMIVNSDGYVAYIAPPGNRYIVAPVTLTSHWTPYRQFGDWWMWASGLLFLVGLKPLSPPIMDARREAPSR